MDIENALNIAKDVLGSAYKKTEEIVAIEKLRASITATKLKRDKDFRELGKLYYISLSGNEIEQAQVDMLTSAIAEKTTRINRYKELIKLYKNKNTTTNHVDIDAILKK